MLSDGNSLALPSLPAEPSAAELRFGKYTALERIGAGGMAEIFKCRLSGIGGFGKLVVVKRILPNHLSNPEFVEMFLDEARVAANLSHPNVVHTYEIDQIDGIPLIAMEYVQGLTFGDLIRAAAGSYAGPWLAIASKVMAGVCEGLHAAHAALDGEGQPLHLVHRDVTPHNILVSVDGIPKLADFGVVQAKGQLASNRSGTLKGKFKYMAPEQFHLSAELDHRVDIFGAGVCLYLATTGRQPYNGQTDVEVIAAASVARFPKPSELVKGFPSELERIILWAMAADREQRCSDAHALAQALEAFVASGDFACTARAVGQRVRAVQVAIEHQRAREGSGPKQFRSTQTEESGSFRAPLRDLGLEMAAQALAEAEVKRFFSGARLRRFAPLLAWLALAALAAATYWAQ